MRAFFIPDDGIDQPPSVIAQAESHLALASKVMRMHVDLWEGERDDDLYGPYWQEGRDKLLLFAGAGENRQDPSNTGVVIPWEYGVVVLTY